MKIKLCGLSRPEDIAVANQLQPDYIGFVFWSKSRRAVSQAQAKALKEMLFPNISAVGVFVDEPIENVCFLLQSGVIDLAQLHGSETDEYIRSLRQQTGKPILQAFRIRQAEDLQRAEQSIADGILLDSGAGSGSRFDWELLQGMGRPYFLAGGLHAGNVREAIEALHPYGLDVSSGIETNGAKDPEKMREFVRTVKNITTGKESPS